MSDYQGLIGQLNQILQEADGLTAEQLNRLLKDAESRGFKKGMLHAAEVVNEMHNPRTQEPSCFAISAKLRQEVHGE